MVEHLDLVVATDARHDRLDVRIGEGRVDVGSSFLRICVDLAGGRVLHGLKLQVRAQPLQAHVMHVWKDSRPGPGR